LLIVGGAGGLVWKGSLVTTWLEDLPRALHFDALVPSTLSQSGGLGWIVLPALAMAALLSGVVVYLATEKQ
jgi:hypothetical protein